MSGLKAGRLRHRITIERPLYTQDTAGAGIVQWVTHADRVPADVSPLSAREFLAAQQVQSQVVARITIRYQAGLDASMRIRHRGEIYNIAGVLADKDSGIGYLTLPVTAGVNAG